MLLTEIKKPKKDNKRKINNLVAKHAYQKGGAHRDKKNDYKRNPKHKKPFLDE